MIGFRVDANEKVAAGHLMRCMAIAEMCRKKGEEVCFFLAEEKESKRLYDKNFPVCILHTDWENMDKELPVLTDTLQKQKISTLVVDSYQATSSYLEKLNECVPVLYLDDMGKEFYSVSAVLHYGIGTDTKEYRERYETQGIRVLAGTKYIPLREEFLKEYPPEERELRISSGTHSAWAGSQKRQCMGKEMRNNRILVTTGGTDPFRIAERFLEACFSCAETEGAFLRKCEYDVIIGALNFQTETLEDMAEKNPHIHLHRNVSNMSDYMRNCKMAVSAGGTTLYELCACGIPAVCFSFADNQEPGTVLFGESGLMDYAGDARRTEVAQELVKALIRLEQDDVLYAWRQKKMMETVDGRGTVRIAEVLCSLRTNVI